MSYCVCVCRFMAKTFECKRYNTIKSAKTEGFGILSEPRVFKICEIHIHIRLYLYSPLSMCIVWYKMRKALKHRKTSFPSFLQASASHKISYKSWSDQGRIAEKEFRALEANKPVLQLLRLKCYAYFHLTAWQPEMRRGNAEKNNTALNFPVSSFHASPSPSYKYRGFQKDHWRL